MNEYCNVCGAEPNDLHLEEDGKHICQLCLKQEERELFEELAFINKVRSRIERRRRKREVSNVALASRR